MASENSPDVMCWQVVAGALAAHEGNKMPRAGSPCGICLDAKVPITINDPECVFPHLKFTFPWISQILAVPLYDAGKVPIGALWLAQHAGVPHFSEQQVLTAERLAMPLVRTIKMLALLQRQTTQLQAATDDLQLERQRRELAEVAHLNAEQALGFKDAEIREAHHRVKNTIQIAAAVLQLQARTSPSSQVRDALQIGRDRLQSLAALHELLQINAGELHPIALPKLIGIIVNALRQSFAERLGHVEVSVNVEPIVLAPESAMQLALLVNEAITNAYKHAFIADVAGELTVNIRRLGDNGLILQISDNGVGMDSSIPVKRGLGVEFMEGFAKQLGGVITRDPAAQGQGTTVTLRIESLDSGIQRS